MPIPQIPPKKTIGNKDVKFINERRFYLERFLKKMASYPYVLNSAEFQAFARPQAGGDIEKLLSKMTPQSNQEIYNKLKTSLEIEEHIYDILRLDNLGKVSDEFKNFAGQMIPLLKAMQKKISIYMQNYSQGIGHIK